MASAKIVQPKFLTFKHTGMATKIIQRKHCYQLCAKYKILEINALYGKSFYIISSAVLLIPHVPILPVKYYTSASLVQGQYTCRAEYTRI